MRTIPWIIGFLIIAATASIATAGPILWTLPPVSLAAECCLPPPVQHATLSGSFVFDAQTGIYSDWLFDISGYTAPVAALNGALTPATSNIVIGGPDMLHLNYASGAADLVLMFGFLTTGGVVIPVPLSDAGGTVPVLITNSARFVSFWADNIGDPAAVSSVPEPAAGFLVLIGAGLLCAWKRISVFRGKRSE